MSIMILGSRTYAPLSDIDAEFAFDTLQSFPAYTFGTSDIALRGESKGAVRKPLEPTRETLLDMAQDDDAQVVLYVAKDAQTKQPTQGMTQIMHLLTERGIEYRRVDSPLPASVCELITNLRHAVDATVKALPGARQNLAMSKALGFSSVVVDERDKYAQRLEEGFNFRVGDDALDTKWIKWLRTYECLCDSLKEAERML